MGHLRDMDVIAKTKEIKNKFCFEYNEEATTKISAIKNIYIRNCFKDEDKILFNSISKDLTKSEIIVTDQDYNMINRFDTSQYSTWIISCIERFKDNYIIRGILLDENKQNVRIFSKDFKLLGNLEDVIPFFKNKEILSFVKDDKGGLYFLEGNTGVLHYLYKNEKILSFQGDFKEPFQVSCFNNTLYMTDLFLWMRLKKACNISIFKNSKFYQTDLTGESICHSSKLDCFFVASEFSENCVKKYDAYGNLVFIKNFDYSKNNYKPTFIEINNNHLLICERNSNSPIVYDIY